MFFPEVVRTFLFVSLATGAALREGTFSLEFLLLIVAEAAAVGAYVLTFVTASHSEAFRGVTLSVDLCPPPLRAARDASVLKLQQFVHDYILEEPVLDSYAATGVPIACVSICLLYGARGEGNAKGETQR